MIFVRLIVAEHIGFPLFNLCNRHFHLFCLLPVIGFRCQVSGVRMKNATTEKSEVERFFKEMVKVVKFPDIKKQLKTQNT